MKKLVLIFAIASVTIFAQYKDDGFNTPSVKDGFINQNSSPLFGFLNSDNFEMKHSFNLSYSSFAGQGLSLGVYTNSMFYKFNDQLNLQVDASLVTSPYNTLGEDFTNNLNGLYLSKAALNYRPSKDVLISIQYRNLPSAFYYNPRNYYQTSDDWFWGR